MKRQNTNVRIGSINTSSIFSIIDTITPIFTELCLSCNYKNLLWESVMCRGCTDNQLFPGNIRKFRKSYIDYRRKRR